MAGDVSPVAMFFVVKSLSFRLCLCLLSVFAIVMVGHNHTTLACPRESCAHRFKISYFYLPCFTVFVHDLYHWTVSQTYLKGTLLLRVCRREEISLSCRCRSYRSIREYWGCAFPLTVWYSSLLNCPDYKCTVIFCKCTRIVKCELI